MADEFDHLHLKRNTAGSSNELSFDVLDAARTGTTKEKRRFRKSSAPAVPGAFPEVKEKKRFRKASAQPVSGTYHGVKKEATLSGQAEVKERKRKRVGHAIRLRVLVAVLVAAAIGGISWFAYQHYTSMQTFSERFDAIIGAFVAEDDFLAEIDSLMTPPIEEKSFDKQQKAAQAIPGKIDALVALRTDVEDAQKLAITDADTIVITEVFDAIAARQDMLSIAQDAFLLVGKENEDVKAAEALWDAVIAADQAARESTELSNSADTEEAIQAAREKTQGAIDQMSAAQQQIDAFSAEHEGVDLTQQKAYTQAKLDSLKQGIATSDALIAGDREEAIRTNERYNELDREAARLAAELPNNLEDIVKKAYDKDLRTFEERYQSARNRVIAADALIRDYLENS